MRCISISKNITVRNNSIAIIGWEEGTAGQIHSWIEELSEYYVSCFVNVSDKVLDIDVALEKKNRDSRLFEYPMKDSFKDRPLITTLDWVKAVRYIGIKNVLITTSDKRVRLKQIMEARSAGLRLINAVHPSALILKDAVLHENIIVHARVVIGYRVEIHDGVIINTGAQLDHHNVIKECVTIDPGVITAGNVTIDQCTQVHTGVVIINRIRVGHDTILGAGTVVIQDVPDGAMVLGVPGRICGREIKK